jgi:hypothetical protein
LKTILKEIDPYGFEEALKVETWSKEERERFSVVQDEDKRKELD